MSDDFITAGDLILAERAACCEAMCQRCRQGIEAVWDATDVFGHWLTPERFVYCHAGPIHARARLEAMRVVDIG